jgi:hypothetical protein
MRQALRLMCFIALTSFLPPLWANTPTPAEETFDHSGITSPIQPWGHLFREMDFFGVDTRHWTTHIIQRPEKARRVCGVGQSQFFQDRKPARDHGVICSVLDLTVTSYVWADASLNADEFLREWIERFARQQWTSGGVMPPTVTTLIKHIDGVPFYNFKVGKAINQYVAFFPIETREAQQLGVRIYVVVSGFDGGTYHRKDRYYLEQHVVDLRAHLKPKS